MWIICNKYEGNFSMTNRWLMMFLTTMLIVEAYDRKFEILGKYENSSPSLVSFIDGSIRSNVTSCVFKDQTFFSLPSLIRVNQNVNLGLKK